MKALLAVDGSTYALRAARTLVDPAKHCADLHVWRVGKRAYSCAISLVTHDVTLTPCRFRKF